MSDERKWLTADELLKLAKDAPQFPHTPLTHLAPNLRSVPNTADAPQEFDPGRMSAVPRTLSEDLFGFKLF